MDFLSLPSYSERGERWMFLICAPTDQPSQDVEFPNFFIVYILEREYPLLIERWEKEHKKGSK